jgi:hypothetical protein
MPTICGRNFAAQNWAFGEIAHFLPFRCNKERVMSVPAENVVAHFGPPFVGWHLTCGPLRRAEPGVAAYAPHLKEGDRTQRSSPSQTSSGTYAAQIGEKDALRGAAFVPMVKATKVRNRHDRAVGGQSDRS